MVAGNRVTLSVTILQLSIIIVGKKNTAQRGEITVHTVQGTVADSITFVLPLLPLIMDRGSQTRVCTQISTGLIKSPLQGPSQKFTGAIGPILQEPLG